jgi:uncharacterized protein with FMN-binding domain
MAAHRMPRGLVALSTSAVAAIYMAGYLRTQAADASIGAADTAATAHVAVVAAAPTPTAAPRPLVQRQDPGTRRGTSTLQPTTPRRTAAQPQAQTQPGFNDGTYTGEGTSRRGDVWVSVQVQGGRIANVTITRSTLQYPLRDIADLPAEVVQRQSAQVDIVSRATYSSMAFRGAVSQALASAATS